MFLTLLDWIVFAAVRGGESCPGCGLANYQGLCPVCRGDEAAYGDELEPHFGPWSPTQEWDGLQEGEREGADQLVVPA